LQPVPGLEDVRLHLADEVLPLWHAVQVETGDADAPLPYWAFAWAGGLAICRHLQDDPAVVVGRRVFDLASGSGLCAIAAGRAGAATVMGADIDAFAAAAIELNARANGQRVTVLRRDVLDDEPPKVDVILAGDCWYDAALADRVLPWLQAAQRRGIDVLVGDPGRRYLPADALVELARYEVRTTTELEDLDRSGGRVYALRSG
jgi:predicted nicotinamide N-methyase